MKLDENFSLEIDVNNVTLVFKETRQNKKEEDYVFEDRWYYPNLKQALIKYLDLSARKEKTIENTLKAIEKTEQNIKTWTQKQ